MSLRRLPLLCSLVLLGGCSAPDVRVLSAPGSAPDARVERVVDGDTLVVRLSDGARERVRLIGVDTPESVKPGTPVECYGKAAASYTARLVEGERVRLESDAEPRDRFGRRLAYVRRTRDGAFLNEELLRRGYAEELTIEPNARYAPRFRALERDARRAGRGRWGVCD